jgi:transposase
MRLDRSSQGSPMSKELAEETHGYRFGVPVYLGVFAMSSVESVSATVPIGVGIDTARYGHDATFLFADCQPAAKSLSFTESSDGYAQLRERLEQLLARHPQAVFHVRIDAAGQYANNLQRFLHDLPLPTTISVGEPARNKHYCRAHFPKRKSDPTDSFCQARFAVVERPAAKPDVPEPFYQLSEIASRLESQGRQSTRLINQLHNVLARTFPELATIIKDLSANYVLKLLLRYPTAERIARAHESSLTAIPYLSEEKAKRIQEAARKSVASFRGEYAEELIRDLVEQINQSHAGQQRLEKLLVKAYKALPAGPHRQVETIVGIGEITAAVLVAKIVSIDRFATPEQLVGFFGTFPEENTSGKDKRGKPVPPGTMEMSRQGNDLVRRYLYLASWSGVQHNPALRALYARQRARGKSGDVALGQCMRKLLHLVFAVWKTDRPFDRNHYPWDQAAPGKKEKAAGRNRETEPEEQAVTAADSKVDSGLATVNATPTNATASSPAVPAPQVVQANFAALRRQVTMEQILTHLGWLADLNARGAQRRGPCPIHSTRGQRHRSFSVNLEKNVFQCFCPECGAKGNALDFWAAYHRLPLREAALHLAKTFQLETLSTEKGNP